MSQISFSHSYIVNILALHDYPSQLPVVGIPAVRCCQEGALHDPTNVIHSSMIRMLLYRRRVWLFHEGC